MLRFSTSVAFPVRKGVAPDDGPDMIYSPVFETLPADPTVKHAVLREAEDVFRLFYQMVEDILTAKEDEEWRHQAAEGLPDSPNLR
ncbi:hypothetical protein ACI65C_004185 [Semiaphis heraclei]